LFLKNENKKNKNKKRIRSGVARPNKPGLAHAFIFKKSLKG
jgi:hypothetical protein